MWTLPPGPPTPKRRKPDRVPFSEREGEAMAPLAYTAFAEAAAIPIPTMEEWQMARRLGLLASGTPPGYLQALMYLLRDGEIATVRRAIAIQALVGGAKEALPVGAVLAGT
jgi:hypothetical protein